MRILIIEDEQAVSKDLYNTILKSWKNTDLPEITQVYSVKEATDCLKNKKEFDLIFSDIQLGDGLCFDIFKQVKTSSPIIFCTAFDDYAIRAFKENGIDYILKPFTRSTIRAALEKYENFKLIFQSNTSSTFDYEQLLQLMSKPREDNNVASILVYIRDKIIPLKREDIALFYVKNNETLILTLNGKTYFPNKSLDELEKITGNYFFRANRQFLVSRAIIDNAYQFFSRKLALELKIDFPEKITISKEKKSAFMEWLSHT